MIDTLKFLLICVFPALTIVAALRDLTSYTIPNWISLALLTAFPVAAFVVGLSWQEVLMGYLAGLGFLVLGFTLFVLRWFGGGDAKLLAASAVWMGFEQALPFMAYVCVGGGALALAILTARKTAGPLAHMGPAWWQKLLEDKGPVPYGLAICAGALFLFTQTPVFQSL